MSYHCKYQTICLRLKKFMSIKVYKILADYSWYSLGQLLRLCHFRNITSSPGMRISDDYGSAPYKVRFCLGEALGGGERGKSIFMVFKTQI